MLVSICNLQSQIEDYILKTILLQQLGALTHKPISNKEVFFFVVVVLLLQRIGGTGERTTLAIVMQAAFIWLLAICCAIPALVGSHVKVIIPDHNL